MCACAHVQAVPLSTVAVARDVSPSPPESSTEIVERLTSHREFIAVLKRRRTVTDRDIVVHVLVHEHADGLARPDSTCTEKTDRSTHESNGSLCTTTHRRLGLAVSKAVGNAVTRNRVKRRFRVLARRHENELPKHCDIIMRARPGSATTPFSALEPQVIRMFAKTQRFASQNQERRTSSQGGRA